MFLLKSGKVIDVSYPITSGANSIGVQMEDTRGVFTSGYGASMDGQSYANPSGAHHKHRTRQPAKVVGADDPETYPYVISGHPTTVAKIGFTTTEPDPSSSKGLLQLTTGDTVKTQKIVIQ